MNEIDRLVDELAKQMPKKSLPGFWRIFYNVYFYVGVFYSGVVFYEKNVVFWKNGLQFDTLIMACSSFFIADHM